jgi:hypothetical protein
MAHAPNRWAILLVCAVAGVYCDEEISVEDVDAEEPASQDEAPPSPPPAPPAPDMDYEEMLKNMGGMGGGGMGNDYMNNPYMEKLRRENPGARVHWA